eukprot:gene12620-biopygen7765
MVAQGGVKGGPPRNLRRGRYSPRDAWWRRVAPRGSPSEPEARTVLPCGTPFPAAGRMMAQGVAKGGPPCNLRRGRYSPVGLLFPQRAACWRRVAPRGSPSEPEARTVLPCGTPFPAAGGMVAQGGAKGGSPSEPEARTVLPCGTPFPAAGRMVAQGCAKGGPPWNLRRGRYSPGDTPWNLRRGRYSPVGLLFPQLDAWWRRVAPRGSPLEPEAWTVLPCGTPFPAAGRMVAQGGPKGYPSEPEARAVLPGGTPLAAAGCMVAQGGAKGDPLWDLRHGRNTPGDSFGWS